MNPYHDANAPPPYTDQHGQPIPPYASSYGEKHPSGGPGYQSVPQGPPYGHPGQQGSPFPQQAAPPCPPHGQLSYAQHPLPPPPSAAHAGQQPTQVIRTLTFGMKPIRIECPMCHANIKTRIWRNNTMKTHLIAVLLCLLCCWPCVCVPYCMASCKDTSHKCPNCQQFLGMYRA